MATARSPKAVMRSNEHYPQHLLSLTAFRRKHQNLWNTQACKARAQRGLSAGWLLPCTKSVTEHTVSSPCKWECYLWWWTSCFFPKLVMGVTACRAVWFNLIAAAYENKTVQRFYTCTLHCHVKNNGKASWKEQTEKWKQAPTSGLSVRYICLEMLLMAHIHWKGKVKLNSSSSLVYKNSSIKKIFLPPRILSCFLLEGLYPYNINRAYQC